jgi:hypothetical protein
MGALTLAERALFDSDADTQLARLSPVRRDEYLDPEEADDGSFRASVLANLAKLTGPQMRARVNVTGISWSRVPTVNYATESDYTTDEKEAIADGLLQGSGWVYQLADIANKGKSLAQRVKALEG